jgi:hypothetical protein
MPWPAPQQPRNCETRDQKNAEKIDSESAALATGIRRLMEQALAALAGAAPGEVATTAAARSGAA